jgi:DNA invertase Pin-like site-specific DNA recombinase
MTTTSAFPFIGYLRVSTVKQGESGLGQAAQRHALDGHIKRVGGRLLDVFTEVESGRKNARPQLHRALAAAKRTGATLLIARLDRLGRNVAFLSKLMDSDIEFVALDVPGANRLTLHVLAAVAEAEARAISERTKAALAAAKARGQRLGNPTHLTRSARLKGARTRARQARERYGLAMPLILEWRADGRTYQAIATELNKFGDQLRGWTAMKVKRVEHYARTPIDDHAA